MADGLPTWESDQAQRAKVAAGYKGCKQMFTNPVLVPERTFVESESLASLPARGYVGSVEGNVTDPWVYRRPNGK